MSDKILPEDRQKAVNEYLSETPVKTKKGFWGKARGVLAVVFKAYLRYEQIKSIRN